MIDIYHSHMKVIQLNRFMACTEWASFPEMENDQLFWVTLCGTWPWMRLRNDDYHSPLSVSLFIALGGSDQVQLAPESIPCGMVYAIPDISLERLPAILSSLSAKNSRLWSYENRQTKVAISIYHDLSVIGYEWIWLELFIWAITHIVII